MICSLNIYKEIKNNKDVCSYQERIARDLIVYVSVDTYLDNPRDIDYLVISNAVNRAIHDSLNNINISQFADRICEDLSEDKITLKEIENMTGEKIYRRWS